jgi:hypothetical protein
MLNGSVASLKLEFAKSQYVGPDSRDALKADMLYRRDVNYSGSFLEMGRISMADSQK